MKCSICDIHDEIYLADENKYYEKKFTTDTAIWSVNEVHDTYNVKIKENAICEHCIYDKYEVGV